MTSLKIALFCRISDPSEKVIMINQRRDTRAHAEKLGAKSEDIKEYTEVESSKGITPVLKRLIEDAKAHRFDLVIFTAPSRMTRGGVEYAFAVLNELASAGVGWHFTDYEVLNFDAGTSPLAKDVILSVIAAIDKDYRRRISEKTKGAMARLKTEGVVVGSPGHRLPCNCAVHRGRVAH